MPRITRALLAATLSAALAPAALLAGAAPTTASPAATPSADTPTSITLSDPAKDVNYYGKDRSAAAVEVTKASDIKRATFTINGTGATATLTARVTIAKVLGKKHAYDQVVGLYAANTIYSVHSNGKHTFTKKPDPTCAQATHTVSGRKVTITIPLPCMAGNLSTSQVDARTWFHRNPKGFTVGGDQTAALTVDYKAQTLARRPGGF